MNVLSLPSLERPACQPSAVSPCDVLPSAPASTPTMVFVPEARRVVAVSTRSIITSPDAVFETGEVSVKVLASALLATFIHRSEEHTSELQSLMRISYAVFCLKKNNIQTQA